MVKTWRDEENEDSDDSEESGKNLVLQTEMKARLQNCSNIVLGHELNGPIQVEKMVVLPNNDAEINKKEQTEYNVGSIDQMFKPEGIQLLEESFKRNPRPDKVERDILAHLTGTRRKMVKKWFAIARSKRKRQLTLKEPLTAITTIWSFWSRKFKRKVLLLGILITVYASASLYCILYYNWYVLLITTGIAFVIIHSALTLLS